MLPRKRKESSTKSLPPVRVKTVRFTTIMSQNNSSRFLPVSPPLFYRRSYDHNDHFDSFELRVSLRGRSS